MSEVTRECDGCGEAFTEPANKRSGYLYEVEDRGEVLTVCIGNERCLGNAKRWLTKQLMDALKQKELC
jgi:hypothetical protein